jgi:hypothetical protein
MIGFINWFKKEPIMIGFEDVKKAIHPDSCSRYHIINTLPIEQQDCLITGTLLYDKEEIVINKILDQSNAVEENIVVYGKNSADDSVKTKAVQLKTLGFKNVFIYSGGLFEWLLLQDIYGVSEFPTTTLCKDLLKYRAPPCMFSSTSLRILSSADI